MTRPALVARGAVLFVSGLDPEGFRSAREYGPDVVCIDLEDAVPQGLKDQARAGLAAMLSDDCGAARTPLVVVRINPLRSWSGIEDLRACIALDDRVRGVMLPKVESADEVCWAAALADDAGAALDMLAIIETSKGLAAAAAIAGAHERLRALVFGGFDLSTELGCTMAWEPLAYARSAVVHAAALAGIDVVDAPDASIADDEGLRASTVRAKALGMTGKAAKTPRQVPVIRDVLCPSPSEIEHAKRIVAAFDAAPGQPLIVDGKLVELPTIKRLRRIGERQ